MLYGPNYIPTAKLPAIERAALAACGDARGVVEDPRACRFEPEVLACRDGAETDACLTDAQIEALHELYAGPPFFHGLSPGAEAEPGGWDAWVVGTGPGDAGRPAQRRFAKTYFGSMVTGDADVDVDRFDLDSAMRTGEKLVGPIIDAIDPDLGAFAHRGGKLIVWHGWNDPVVPPGDSIEYRDAVRAKLGGESAFYRLFLGPGMLHCDGGRGPTELPTREAIEAWVERGVAPARLSPPGWTIDAYR